MYTYYCKTCEELVSINDTFGVYKGREKYPSLKAHKVCETIVRKVIE